MSKRTIGKSFAEGAVEGVAAGIQTLWQGVLIWCVLRLAFPDPFLNLAQVIAIVFAFHVLTGLGCKAAPRSSP